jgi:CysZ protein
MTNNRPGYALAITSWFGAWAFIFKNRLSHFFIYPLVVSALLAMGAVVFINKGVKLIMGFIEPYFEYQAPEGTFWEKTKNLLMDASEMAAPFIIWVISIYVFLRLNKYLVLALLSPMLSILSEKSVEILTGESRPFSISQLFQDALRGSILALRNLIIELALTLIVWGILLVLMLFMPFLIFILGPVASILVFFIGSYFFGFSVLDYVNERNNLNVKESIADIRKNRSLSIGLGSIFSLLFVIPFVGISISSVTCTVAAAIAKVELNENLEN